jgi:hypothetical protein
MKRLTRWLLGALLAAVLLPIPAWIAWEVWRERTLLAFCKEAKAGMSFSEILHLERRHWINDSYIVQAMFAEYVDQAHSFDLEFRSHMLDPEFACLISHDGRNVKSVQIVALEGFDTGK